MAKKKKIDDEEEIENNLRPLTNEEIAKIEQKKRIKELREKSRDQVQIIITKSGEVKRADELTLDEQMEEYVRCANNPIYFIETYLTIFDQTKKNGSGEIVPFKLFEFQKQLIKSYLSNKQNIANKYRQAGVSTTTCAYIAWYILFNENRTVAVIADKLETARDELLYDIIEFVDNCPSFLKPRIAGKDTAHHKKYSNNSQIKAFAATKLRGITPTLIFWDETAWTEHGEDFWTSAKPTLSTGGRAIFVSTPNGLDSVFYANFDKATRKENDFNAIELWWYNDPRYGKDLYWIKNEAKDNEFRLVDENFSFEKRKQFILDGFQPRSPWYVETKRGYNGNLRKLAQEVECSFLGSGENFIAEEYVKRIEDHELKAPIAEGWEDKLLWVWEEPIPGMQYIITVDVSTGHGDDYSSVNLLKVFEVSDELNIVDANNNVVKKKIKRRKTEQVAQYYGKLTPQQLAQVVYACGQKYNYAYAVIDITGGVGLGTLEKLIEFGYPLKNIHYSEIQHKPSRDRLSNWVKTSQKEVSPGVYVKVDLIPGFMIGSNRAMILHELERAVRMQDIIIRSRRTTAEFKTLQTKQGKVAEAKRSFNDDDVMSLSMGIYIISFDLFRGQSSMEKTKAMLDAIMVIGIDDNIQPDEIKKREGSDVRFHANPYGQDGWLIGGKAAEQARIDRLEEKRKENERKMELLRANPNAAKYL